MDFPLSELIKRAEPTSKAKFVEFVTLADQAQMPGVGMAILKWPYLEGVAHGRSDAPADDAYRWAVR